VVEHTYDADGVRVRTETRKPDGTTETVDYLVDTSGPFSQVVAETHSGAMAAYYVRGDDLLAVIRPGAQAGSWTSRYYHADGLGSIRTLTDENGIATDRWSFTAFGELLEHTGEDPNAYLFAGEALDPDSGFYYMRARWLDPGAGEFVSVDPFMGLPFEPRTLHKYLYVGANPVDRVDPTGRFEGGLIELNVVNAIRSEITSIQLNTFLDLGSAADKSGDISKVRTVFALIVGGLALVTLVRSIFRYGARAVKSVAALLQDAKELNRIRSSYSRQEVALIMEARALINSDGMDAIREAYRSGQGVTVTIGNRPIQYEPAFKDFAITNKEMGGFLVGPLAVASEEELSKTILWELHRLELGNPFGAPIDGVASRLEFEAAQEFSERAFREVLNAIQ
jgi:RHS repeat-associated protein